MEETKGMLCTCGKEMTLKENDGQSFTMQCTCGSEIKFSVPNDGQNWVFI